MHSKYVDDDNNNDGSNYTIAVISTSVPQQQQPLLAPTSTSVVPKNHHQQQPQQQHHYGSCIRRDANDDADNDDDVMILQSDSDNDDDTRSDDEFEQQQHRIPPPPPPPPSSFCIPVPLFVVGSVPHSVLVATTIGIACGISAYIYNWILQYSLVTIWKTWSQQLLLLLYPISDLAATSLPIWTILWIPIVTVLLSIGLGYTVRYVGEPGDLASTIQCVHLYGWIELSHALPMALASLFSIVAGASVGPEAALVAICATLAGFISQSIFRINPKLQRNLVRKHTLMGVRLKYCFLV
jgi:hypothetical protein